MLIGLVAGEGGGEEEEEEGERESHSKVGTLLGPTKINVSVTTGRGGYILFIQS